jgi:DNA anti-recombination protein RmuC
MNADVLSLYGEGAPAKPTHVVARAASTKVVPRKRTGADAMTTVAPAVPETAKEEMLGQLRDIINGPQAQLNEARYAEFVDILADVKDASDKHMATLDEALNAVQTQSRSQFEDLAQRLDTSSNDLTLRVDSASSRLDVEVHALRQSQTEALVKLRDEQQNALLMLASATDQRLREIEDTFRNGLAQMSATIATQVADDAKKRDEERMAILATVEHQINHARSEIMHDYSREFSSVGGSIMEIGRKLMENKKA